MLLVKLILVPLIEHVERFYLHFSLTAGILTLDCLFLADGDRLVGYWSRFSR